MDKRSWLWRRKSSEKSPGGETESTGSVSSYSERFFDDQAYTAHTTQSPEVTSKAVLIDEDVNESVKTLKDSLSAALLDISTKDDLVKQHAKVAEEAISGWEKAENEVSILKKKLEASNQKSFALEERLGHLDHALKECMRQLRQAREEQEQKIQEAIAKKTNEWESSKTMLECQLADLQGQLRNAEMEALASIGSNLQPKLEAAERENSTLKLELHSKAKELEIGIIERDLSIKAAETASKQHLESIKKVAKLESECRRLKAIVQKTSQSNNPKPLSPYIEERLIGIESMTPSVEINLMDDFLEMERLASQPIKEGESDQCNLKASLEAAIQRSTELEGKIENIEMEKMELLTALSVCQKQLKDSRNRLLVAETELQELQNQLSLANSSKRDLDKKLEASQRKSELVESQLRVAEKEAKALLHKVGLLEEAVQKGRSVSNDNLAECKKLENELSAIKLELENRKKAELHRNELSKADVKSRQEKELALAAEKFAQCQKTIASLGQQLNSLTTLEDLLMDSENEKPLELSGDTTQSYSNGIVQNLHSSNLSLPKRDSEFFDFAISGK